VTVIPLDVADRLDVEQHFQSLPSGQQRKVRLILHLMQTRSTLAQVLQLKHFFKDLADMQTEFDEVAKFDCKMHPAVLLFKGSCRIMTFLSFSSSFELFSRAIVLTFQCFLWFVSETRFTHF